MKMTKILVLVVGVILVAAFLSFGCKGGGEEAPSLTPSTEEEGGGGITLPETQQPSTTPATTPGEEATVITSVKLINPNSDELDKTSNRISRYAKIAINYTGPKPEGYILKYKGNDVPLSVAEDVEGKLVLKPDKPMHNRLKAVGDPAEYVFTVAEDDHSFDVKAAGDINGDGSSDLVVGAPHLIELSGGHFKGAAIILPGGSSVAYSQYDDSGAVNLVGYPDAEFGRAVALGDVNGDGLDDVAVGAEAEGSNHGCVYVFYGLQTLTTLLAQDAKLRICRDNGTDSFFGNALAIGDVNNDGFGDVIIGEYGAEGLDNASVASNDKGAAHVVFGKAEAFDPSQIVFGSGGQPQGTISFDGGLHHSYVGKSVSAADVNGDGIMDIVIGAPTDGINNPTSGAVYIVLGASTSELDAKSGKNSLVDPTLVQGKSDVKLKTSDPNNERFGYSVAAMTLDGKDGVLVGANASAYKYIDGVGVEFITAMAFLPKGWIVGWLGNGIAVGYPDQSLLFIRDASNTWLPVIHGVNPSSELGCSVSPLGDFIHDGSLDYVVGEKNSPGFSLPSGSVIVNGTMTIKGKDKSQFGYSVAGGRIR